MTDFTKSLGEWLGSPADQRNYEKGAMMLLQLSRNQFLYRKVSANLGSQRNRDIIEYNLKKFYAARLATAEHAEVEALQAKADKIAIARHLDPKPAPSEAKSGKRADHDSLPDEIKQCYVENLEVLRRMREVHLRLRMMSQDTEGKFCPDSDRYPFLKELIALDRKYRENWHRYDTYGQPQSEKEISIAESQRCLRMVNLNKGKYAKNPNETLAAQLRDWYDKILSPSQKLADELKALGII